MQVDLVDADVSKETVQVLGVRRVHVQVVVAEELREIRVCQVRVSGNVGRVQDELEQKASGAYH